MALESELEDDKKRLWENINRKSIVSDTDVYNLQKLLTFIEMPSLIKDNSRNRNFLPDILSKSYLVNRDPKSLNKKSFFIQTENDLMRSKSRISTIDLRNIIERDIKIDENLGYMPINPELAVALRQLTYGSLKLSFSMDWRKSYFLFKEANGPMSHSFQSEKNSVRSFIVCVQSHFLKNLLYPKEYAIESRTKQLCVSESKRLACLITSLADILWMVGEEKRAIVCLSSKIQYVDSSPFYNCDDITETIQIFKFKSYHFLTEFLRKNINYFTTGQYCGCILFLYSIALSKGLQELLEDFEFDQNKSLLSSTETLSHSGINLILTGYATEFFHNGVQLPSVFDNKMATPKYGIKHRSQLGYLQYNSPKESEHVFYRSKNVRRASEGQNVSSGEDIEQLYVVGSMLKTPICPIWVVNGDGNFGILFSLRDDLLSHWRAENNFQLYYLNCLKSQYEPCILSICTKRGRTAKFKTPLMLKEDSKKIPLLNHIINTKWFGCRIDWNNKYPFI